VALEEDDEEDEELLFEVVGLFVVLFDDTAGELEDLLLFESELGDRLDEVLDVDAGVFGLRLTGRGLLLSQAAC
jgi:hypothetical protein